MPLFITTNYKGIMTREFGVMMRLLVIFMSMCVTLAFITAPVDPQVIVRATTTTTTPLCSSASDDDFLASLKSRVDEINENRLPLVVLDSMLPRQVLKITVNDPTFMKMIRHQIAAEAPYFGMLGMARLASGATVHLRSGVQVDVVGTPAVEEEGLKMVLRGGRRFEIASVHNAHGGWTEAKVNFLDDNDNEEDVDPNDRLGLARAYSKAQKLDDLVPEWIKLARTHERQPGQIDQLLLDLEEMPESPTDRAFWVGALINPLPAMGVSLEIRPALLTAKTAEERVDVVLQGIRGSIENMQQM